MTNAHGIRHRSPTQNVQVEASALHASSNGLGSPVDLGSRATVDGSMAMDRANGPHWYPPTRDSLTGGEFSPRDSYTGGATPLRDSFTGGSALPFAVNEPASRGSWHQQLIERGWASGKSPLSNPRQRGQPHRLQAMSTDGGLSLLHAQPSAPRWTPSLVHQEGWDGWDASEATQRCESPCKSFHWALICRHATPRR